MECVAKQGSARYYEKLKYGSSRLELEYQKVLKIEMYGLMAGAKYQKLWLVKKCFKQYFQLNR